MNFKMSSKYPVYFFLIAFCLIKNNFASNSDLFDTSYWVWGGGVIRKEMEPQKIYLFQGKLRAQSNKYYFSKQGLFPYPANAKNLYLVFRLDGLDTSSSFMTLLTTASSRWKSKGNNVIGYQLDYDCPTRKLPQYAAFLRRLRTQLEPGMKLSVTGLTDWALSSPSRDLKNLSNSTDEIVFQMYEGRKIVVDLLSALSRLEKIGFGYKVGILSIDSVGINTLSYRKEFPHCHGMIIFPIQSPEKKIK